MHRGQDINFDQLNYHFYSVFAFLHRRWAIDVAPASTLHSYFNPLPYLPFYLMVQHLPPRSVIFLLGAWHACNLALVAVITWQVTVAISRRSRLVLCACGVLIAVASPMAWSEFGSSFADITTSLSILAGLSLMIEAAAPRRADRAGAWLAAGAFFVGLAIGLKLTNMIYAPGVAVCCAIGVRGWKRVARALALAALGGTAGTLLAGGAWSLRLWRQFASPVFPYYDAIFRAPALIATPLLHGRSFFDRMHLPHSLWQALALPFRWLSIGVSTCELPFRDIRFALLAVLLCVLGLRAFIGLVRGRGAVILPAGQGRLLAFLAASFVTWTFQFAIQRYVVSLELLVGPSLVIILTCLLSVTASAGASAALAVLCLVSFHAPNWGRIRPGDTWFGVTLPPAIARPGIALLQDEALSYLVPFLPEGSAAFSIVYDTMIQAGSNTVADRRLRQALQAGVGNPVYVLASTPVSSATRRLLDDYGLALSGPCPSIASRPNAPIACLVHASSDVGQSAVTLQPGVTMTFDDRMSDTAALLGAVHVQSGWGIVGGGAEPALEVRLDQRLHDGASLLHLGVEGFQALDSGASVLLLAGGRVVAKFHAADAALPPVKAICVPASDFASGDLVLRFRYVEPARPHSPGIPMHIISLAADPVASCAAGGDSR